MISRLIENLMIFIPNLGKLLIVYAFFKKCFNNRINTVINNINMNWDYIRDLNRWLTKINTG